METSLPFKLLPQPDLVTCGPTCLHSVFRYHGLERPLAEVIKETRMLEGGGTLGAMLGLQALDRGFHTRIYTYNLELFDPTWFRLSRSEMIEKLRQQLAHKRNRRLSVAGKAYIEFLTRGGEVVSEDLTADLIRRHLKRNIPIIAGLSSTFLYQGRREIQETMIEDDVRGTPTGHFVVLHGYDAETRHVLVADPFRPNPISGEVYYSISIERVICAILTGIITYDCNMIIIKPREDASK